MKKFVSFGDYATEDVIIRLLCRERAKYAVKNSGKTGPVSDSLYKDIAALMPPRNKWINPPKDLRSKKGRGISAWTYPRKIAYDRVHGTVKKLRKQGCDDEWSKNLDAFIGCIRGIVKGSQTFKMESPRVIPMFKKKNDSGEYIFRPLCIYSSLETKIMLALTYSYLLDQLDDCFHANMLFMRTARPINNSNSTPDDKDALPQTGHGQKRNGNVKYHTPNYKDAILMASEYRRRHNGETIFVGECDIQKFYDILNHDVVLECFDSIFKEKAKRVGVDSSDFESARKILEAYLKSYSYVKDVYALNECPEHWKAEKRKYATFDIPDPVCRYDWVSDEDFVQSGGYTPESLAEAKACGILGVPQGGALSGIIVNVVMQCIDDEIVRPKDPDRFFVRYCDDILLMHSDKDKCKWYLDTYIKNLQAHKLVPHKAKDVAGELKNGVRTKAEFWKAKSKTVFKWGSGNGDASDWIAFVGYEMRRTGEIRVRKDKITEQFRHIARAYHQLRTAGEGRETMALERFESLPEKILDYEMMTLEPGRNRYVLAQARRLDKYLVRKLKQAARRRSLSLPVPLVTYTSVIKHASEKASAAVTAILL